MGNEKINEAKSKLFDSLKDEMDSLSPIKRWLFETLFDKIWSIFSSDCKETDVAYAVNALGKVNSEYVKESDFMNYDESMKVLGFSHNRTGFKYLMDAKGIEQVIFKSHKVGFKRSDIMSLKEELDEKRAEEDKKKNYTVRNGKRHYRGLSMIEKSK